MNDLANNAPELITHMISVLGGVLPALGIGMLMNIVIKDKFQLVFFFLGFVLLAFGGLDTIPVVFIAAAVAYLYYLAKSKTAAAPVAQTQGTDAVYEDPDLF